MQHPLSSVSMSISADFARPLDLSLDLVTRNQSAETLASMTHSLQDGDIVETCQSVEQLIRLAREQLSQLREVQAESEARQAKIRAEYDEIQAKRLEKLASESDIEVKSICDDNIAGHDNGSAEDKNSMARPPDFCKLDSFSEFEAEFDPFQTAELDTINDLNELASVLKTPVCKNVPDDMHVQSPVVHDTLAPALANVSLSSPSNDSNVINDPINVQSMALLKAVKSRECVAMCTKICDIGFTVNRAVKWATAVGLGSLTAEQVGLVHDCTADQFWAEQRNKLVAAMLAFDRLDLTQLSPPVNKGGQSFGQFERVLIRHLVHEVLACPPINVESVAKILGELERCLLDLESGGLDGRLVAKWASRVRMTEFGFDEDKVERALDEFPTDDEAALNSLLGLS